MKRIFSGIQPSGNLQLGNYLGAIRNWAQMQNDYECIFCVVDLHAITLPQDPLEMRGATREVAAGVIAGGVNPETALFLTRARFLNTQSWHGCLIVSHVLDGSIE